MELRLRSSNSNSWVEPVERGEIPLAALARAHSWVTPARRVAISMLPMVSSELRDIRPLLYSSAPRPATPRPAPGDARLQLH